MADFRHFSDLATVQERIAACTVASPLKPAEIRHFVPVGQLRTPSREFRARGCARRHPQTRSACKRADQALRNRVEHPREPVLRQRLALAPHLRPGVPCSRCWLVWVRCCWRCSSAQCSTRGRPAPGPPPNARVPTTDVTTSSMARCGRESRSAPPSRAYPRSLPIGEPPPSRLPGKAKDTGVP